LQFQNRDPIAARKSLIDFEIKIEDRFSYANRDPISRSVCNCSPKTGFQSLIDFEIKIADRFSYENRDPVARSKSVTDFSGLVFYRDHGCNCSFKITIRLQNNALEKSSFHGDDTPVRHP
jgi:hypothetical protein